MKLHIISDLHIDSYSRRNLDIGSIPETASDIVLVAGDVSNSDMGMKWLVDESSRLQKPILAISGNHEYFDEDVLSFDKTLASHDSYDSQLGYGLRYLQCQSFDFATDNDEIRVLGCTLWTDYKYQADKDTFTSAKAFMRDYQEIKAGSQMFTPEVSVEIHHRHRQWLRQSLMQAYEQGKKTIVMTHHSISPNSIADKYSAFKSNAAFISDFSDWLTQDWSPALWIHGHTHEAFDYVQGNTRVIVNPRGYPTEVSSTDLLFQWDKVVEI